MSITPQKIVVGMLLFSFVIVGLAGVYLNQVDIWGLEVDKDMSSRLDQLNSTMNLTLGMTEEMQNISSDKSEATERVVQASTSTIRLIWNAPKVINTMLNGILTDVFRVPAWIGQTAIILVFIVILFAVMATFLPRLPFFR